jgi:hypothetical protein
MLVDPESAHAPDEDPGCGGGTPRGSGVWAAPAEGSGKLPGMRRFAVLGRSAIAMALLVLLGLSLPGVAVARQPRTAAKFKPRVGFAMGILPHRGVFDPAAGTAPLVVYRGGQVMRGVTLHTVFWAAPGYRFDGSPGGGAPGYEALIKQFLVDVTRGGPANADIFSTLTQYHDRSGSGDPQLSYDPTTDSTDLATPYPGLDSQCASPSGTATCLTDAQLQSQLDSLIAGQAPRARGLTNLWLIFLPPNVDTCILAGTCATHSFAGYHGVFDRGHGPTVYVTVPDPLIEQTPPPGSDPQGNPEAELALDSVAHEVEESVTDPYGTGWLDPMGFEVGDKCEFGPQQGSPLGYAPDGSPYNQLINGHEYLLQDMWSNDATGCVQGSTAAGPPADLPAVSLRQFSPEVSGSLGHPGRETVQVELSRGLVGVASATARTRPDGSWGPVRLRSANGDAHAVGDDRELLAVSYGFGPGAPPPEIISTVSSGNPFSLSGYTDWTDLDAGVTVGTHGVEVAPCGQVGVLSLRVGGLLTEPPAQLCSTQTDAAAVPTKRIGPGTRVFFSSEDNRAVLPSLTPQGALIKLTTSPGEPDATPTLQGFGAVGIPVCDAFLRVRVISCAGLVPGARYRLDGRPVRPGFDGIVSISGLRLRGGQRVALINRAGRRVTTLHIAHLRVDLTAEQTRVTGGTCQPGDFYGLSSAASSLAGQLLGSPVTATSAVCPLNGSARGLSTRVIAQTDDFSGGQTVVSVPAIRSTAPIQDETFYGGFAASAQSGLPGPNGSVTAGGTPIALRITPVGSGRAVFSSANVDTARGVAVRSLAPGTYLAHWRLHDANGDTRTLITRFVEAG